MKQLVQLVFMLCWITHLTDAYPVESKPLNNNPDTWNFGEGWLLFNPRNSADPYASALISSDPHIKKSKITPKSIFIAPNSYSPGEPLPCPYGFRVDDNGKCIKTVTINQDEILAARISELFGVDTNPNTNSDTNSDYYDFDDDSKSEKDSGPLQINLPLSIDVEEDTDGKKVEYVIEEEFVVRNLNPKAVITTTTEKPEETTTTTTAAPITESTESVTTEEAIISSTVTIEEAATTDTAPADISTMKYDEVEMTSSSTAMPTTEEPITETTTTTREPSTTTTTTTQATTTTTTEKIFSVDFLPKFQRKTNRLGIANARLKNSRDRDKIERPRKQKTTVSGLKSNDKVMTKLYKIERDQVPKKNRTRNGSKRRKLAMTTTEIVTEAPVTTTIAPTTQKPFWWLPRGWSIDESKEKPVLVRFWNQQPLHQDVRARSHNARQRQNSRMPTDSFFREATAPELVMKQ